MLAATALLALTAAASAASDGARYAFYRDMEAHEVAGGRRVFGGQPAGAEAWGAACALLDRYWSTRCSGAVVASRWVLTAAHCVSPHVAYVKYNARRARGEVQPALYLYRHPQYRAVEEDEGRGPDVTLLQHDVGLVRTRWVMRLARRPALAPLHGAMMFDAADIRAAEVEVLGFGRTEGSARGEVLHSARLRVVPCERAAWFRCVCGAGAGVCAGDSGGPVLYRGAQVGVTSMGPVRCGDGGAGGGTSVFTALAQYVALINGTMRAAEAALRAGAPRPPRAPALLAGAALLGSTARGRVT